MRKTRPLSGCFNVQMYSWHLSNDVTMHVDIHGHDIYHGYKRSFCIRVVHYGISCPRASKNLGL